jgi:Mn-dependent DtxR family transcriptional regulator
MDKDGLITLTEKGMAIADRIYDRHKTLTTFLVQMGVNAETAAQDACKLEHDMSDETFQAIRNRVQADSQA